jgi:hypothetical protein
MKQKNTRVYLNSDPAFFLTLYVKTLKIYKELYKAM